MPELIPLRNLPRRSYIRERIVLTRSLTATYPSGRIDNFSLSAPCRRSQDMDFEIVTRKASGLALSFSSRLGFGFQLWRFADSKQAEHVLNLLIVQE